MEIYALVPRFYAATPSMLQLYELLLDAIFPRVSPGCFKMKFQSQAWEIALWERAGARTRARRRISTPPARH